MSSTRAPLKALTQKVSQNITYIFAPFIRISFIALLTISFAPNVLAACNNLLDFESQKLHSSQSINFCEAFSGKTLLVVNTASRCGFTPQFKALESLYQKYKDQGLEIVGFPSNSFRQELASEAQTASVCYKNYGVSFTMLSTSDVAGPEQNAFFKQLSELSGHSPEWNFNKYLISADLTKVDFFGSGSAPMGGPLEARIQALLP